MVRFVEFALCNGDTLTAELQRGETGKWLLTTLFYWYGCEVMNVVHPDFWRATIRVARLITVSSVGVMTL